MTAYVAIADADIDPESPLTTTLMTRIRDNPLAIREGDPTAPKILDAAISHDLQTFNSSGTWTKPANISGEAVIQVELWGGGAGGSSYGGGGGGGYSTKYFKASELSATVAITIGAGGAFGNPSVAGGNTTFAAYLTGYGGGASANPDGGGGGGTGGAGGTPAAGTGVAINSVYGFRISATDGAGAAGTSGSAAVYGGGGGGGAVSTSGGNSVYGGGGGAYTGSAGTSTYGGNGGAGTAAGTAPGGGGGYNGAGAAGKCVVRIL